MATDPKGGTRLAGRGTAETLTRFHHNLRCERDQSNLEVIVEILEWLYWLERSNHLDRPAKLSVSVSIERLKSAIHRAASEPRAAAMRTLRSLVWEFGPFIAALKQQRTGVPPRTARCAGVRR